MTRAAPAFQFYRDDFLGGTTHFTAEEIGVYLLLLLHQYSYGKVPLDAAKIERITRASYDLALGVLEDKFDRSEDGWRNERMSQTVELQQIRREAASKGGSKTQANGQAKPQANGQAKGQAKPNPPSPSPSPRRIDIDQINSDRVTRRAEAICKSLGNPKRDDRRLARQVAILVEAGVYSEHWMCDSVEAVVQGKRKGRPWGYFLTSLRNKAKESGRDFDTDRKLVPP